MVEFIHVIHTPNAPLLPWRNETDFLKDNNFARLLSYCLPQHICGQIVLTYGMLCFALFFINLASFMLSGTPRILWGGMLRGSLMGCRAAFRSGWKSMPQPFQQWLSKKHFREKEGNLLS